jgi:hypothetical protein
LVCPRNVAVPLDLDAETESKALGVTGAEGANLHVVLLQEIEVACGFGRSRCRIIDAAELS